MSDVIGVKVHFSNLLVNASEIRESGRELHLPISDFKIWKNDDGSFYCRYEEADENFDGKSVKEVIKKLRSFLRSDPCVRSVGKEVVEEINEDSEVRQ